MSPFLWVAVAVITVLSSARITRLLTQDAFPPIRAARNAYIDWTDKRAWSRGYGLLGYCPYCMSPWVTAAVVLWGWLSDFQTAWWVVNAIFGASYLAVYVVVYDGDEDEG